MRSLLILAALGPFVLTLLLIVAIGKWLKASRKAMERDVVSKAFDR